MAVKKGRGKPKPNKVYHAPNNGAMRRMQQSLHRYDDRVTQFELKWGVDRVIWLVPTELRNRFEQQMDRLNDAIDKMQDVDHQVEVTIKGIAALEQAPIAAGVEPLKGEWIEGSLPDGRVLAIVPTDYEVSKVKRDNREMVVYSVKEIGRILEDWEASKPVEEVKHVFDGAVVEKIRTPTEEELNDEIPF